MKRIICWWRGHNWRLIMFMEFPFVECSRCGITRLEVGAELPVKNKERIRF